MIWCVAGVVGLGIWAEGAIASLSRSIYEGSKYQKNLG